ncbi:MAG: GH32 C-terminal domain-containing protein, partial [Muribaculaceae bacterium]|nr:GH32 C-terminal domain-containing protein [Muribaculaceae bacterium]
MQYRSANTLPREIGLFKGPDGEIYASSAPAPELLSMRGDITLSKNSVKLSRKPSVFNLPAARDGVCEIVLDITGADKENVTVTLANKEGDRVDMVYDGKDHTFAVDRRQSGVVDFSENFPAVTVAPTFETSGKVSLRIFVDRSSIEVFGNDGQFVLTNLVFPRQPYSTIALSSASGKAKVTGLRVYSLK